MYSRSMQLLWYRRFTMSGVLGDFNVTSRLPEIKDWSKKINHFRGPFNVPQILSLSGFDSIQWFLFPWESAAVVVISSQIQFFHIFSRSCRDSSFYAFQNLSHQSQSLYLQQLLYGVLDLAESHKSSCLRTPFFPIRIRIHHKPNIDRTCFFKRKAINPKLYFKQKMPSQLVEIWWYSFILAICLPAGCKPSWFLMPCSSVLFQVPVLLTSGRFDTMRPSVVRSMQQRLPNSEWKMFLENAKRW